MQAVRRIYEELPGEHSDDEAGDVAADRLDRALAFGLHVGKRSTRRV